MFALRKKKEPVSRSLGGLARDEGGVIAVILALMLGVLAGMMALAMDLGKAWNLETELQHAADACALAGATQLDGSNGARARAIKACISELARNQQKFATDNVDADSLGGADGFDVRFDTSVLIDGGTGKALNRDIKFYDNPLPIATAPEATTDAEASYIEANVFPRTVDFSFAAVVGAVTSASPSGRAVAGWQSFFCDSPPMMMCNPNEDPAGDETASFNMYTDCPEDGNGTSCVGRGITMKARAGAPEPGDFGYLSLSVYDPVTGTTTTVNGAKELKSYLVNVEFDAVCTGNQVTTEPGNIASLDQYINMRFDLYPTLDDQTNPNRQPSPNVGKGLVRKDPSADLSLGNCKYNPASEADSGDWKHPEDALGNPEFYRGPGMHTPQMDGAGNIIVDGNDMGQMTTPIRAMAYPKDTCNYTQDDTDEAAFLAQTGEAVTIGEGGCLFKVPPGDPTPEGRQMGTAQYDLQIYLDVYHPGMTEFDLLADGADLPNSFNPPIGPDGKISRWELYNWEKRAAPAYPNMAYEEEPICYRGGDIFVTEYDLPEPPADTATLDRRIMVMAVINCAAMGGGKRTVDRTKPHGNVAVFMTEPMGYTVADTLFGEMVDPRGLGDGAEASNPALVKELILLIEGPEG